MSIKLKIVSLSLLTTLAIISCKKDKVVAPFDGGMINVTNAIIGAPTITMISQESIVSYTNQINSYNSTVMPLASGQQTIRFGIPAVPATATVKEVPEIIYFTQDLTMDNSSNYSLFLTGTSTATVESVVIKESYPRTYSDSVCGVRFINLSTGSAPISVNLKGNTNGSEAGSLAYKAYNDFKLYPAKRATANYIFEFRDATTGTLLATFTMTMPYFHNTTLCLRGKAGAYGVIQNNDF